MLGQAKYDSGGRVVSAAFFVNKISECCVNLGQGVQKAERQRDSALQGVGIELKCIILTPANNFDLHFKIAVAGGKRKK